MRVPVRRRAACSIAVGHVDLVLESPAGDWSLECTRCPWQVTAVGFPEAVVWARGHDDTHRWGRRLMGWLRQW